MTESSVLLQRLERGVLHLTLNRPETLNALNVELMEALNAALEAAASDASVGVVLLSGAGRGFSSGGDLRSGATRRPAGGAEESFEEWADGLRAAMELSRLLHVMPKPTLAMLRGPVAGAGLAIACACDLRVASDTTVLTTAFARVGFSGDFGITWFLTRLVGTAKARELMFLSDKIDAAEALRIGLVQRVVPDAQLESAGTQLAQQLADGPRVAYRYIKRNLNVAETGRLEDVLDLEAHHLTRTRMTEDHQEAVRAFTEKRAPVFKGK